MPTDEIFPALWALLAPVLLLFLVEDAPVLQKSQGLCRSRASPVMSPSSPRRAIRRLELIHCVHGGLVDDRHIGNSLFHHLLT